MYLVHTVPKPGLPDFSWNNLPKQGKIYEMTIKLPNGQKIYHHFPFQGPPKYTQIGILGIKMYNLANLP
jgi:hypothetical protein